MKNDLKIDKKKVSGKFKKDLCIQSVQINVFGELLKNSQFAQKMIQPIFLR